MELPRSRKQAGSQELRESKTRIRKAINGWLRFGVRAILALQSRAVFRLTKSRWWNLLALRIQARKVGLLLHVNPCSHDLSASFWAMLLQCRGVFRFGPAPFGCAVRGEFE